MYIYIYISDFHFSLQGVATAFLKSSNDRGFEIYLEAKSVITTNRVRTVPHRNNPLRYLL